MAQTETLIAEDDLEALMDQLEAETKDMIAAPAPIKASAPAAPPATEDDLNGLDELDEVVKAAEQSFSPTPPPAAVAAPAEEIDPRDAAVGAVEADANDPEAALAELEAELAGSIGKAPATARIVAGGGDGVIKAEASIPAKDDTEHLLASAANAAHLEKSLTEAAAGAAKPRELVEAEIEHPNPPPKPRPSAPDAPIDIAAFRDETRVSETNLDSCMMEQAGLFAYYAAQAAQKEAAAARLKVQVEIAEAKLYDAHRKALATSGEKVTEKMVENAVRLDPKYGAIHAKLIDAESVAAVAKGLVESLKQRRDMIIQLGADRREEGKGAARILAAADAHNDTKARAAAAAKR